MSVDFDESPWGYAERKMAEQADKQARAELRDRFAIAALTGLLAAGDHHAYNRDEAAHEAWRQADAMMKARGQ